LHDGVIAANGDMQVAHFGVPLEKLDVLRMQGVKAPTYPHYIVSTVYDQE
jgi:hypothetical protein